jgi:hypothetical protein
MLGIHFQAICMAFFLIECVRVIDDVVEFALQ